MNFVKAALKKLKSIFVSTVMLRIGMTIPALAGMALLSFGISLIYLPAGIIAAGILLLLVDARL